MRASEHIECSPDFAQDIADLFGVNYLGEPMFRFIWGQTETEVQLTPQGNYEERFIGHNQPCWILQMWEPAETYGPPEVFYYLNTDTDYGLPVMAYPEFGRYKEISTFLFKQYDPTTQQLNLSTITLDWATLDRLVPLLLASLSMSIEMIRARLEEIEAEEETAKVQEIADRLDNELPNFYGPVSYAGQANRTALIDRKMAEIENIWRKHNLRRPPMRGLFQKPN